MFLLSDMGELTKDQIRSLPRQIQNPLFVKHLFMNLKGKTSLTPKIFVWVIFDARHFKF